MLFNSNIFIFIFLPISIIGYYFLAKIRNNYALTWLACASLFFYTYWKIDALPILITSILFNYAIGVTLISQEQKSKLLLLLGITGNILMLCYFKYLSFFIFNINLILDYTKIEELNYSTIILPIGISFFTFTQIGYLIDSYQKRNNNKNLIHYILFVSFFPHLIAGPIISHKNIIPQFSDSKIFQFDLDRFAKGISIFIIGLAKKVIIADTLATNANIFFDQAVLVEKINTVDAWLGSFSYTLQLYFDFSGYSDMAIGLALLFGIYLPINFNTPLKATNISDFWKRWHMSLTNFINQYVYNPISLKLMRIGIQLNKFGEVIFCLILPTIFTFIIIGFWHGANWTFILFGLMHGLFVVLNQLWKKRNFLKINTFRKLNSLSAWLLTFIAVNASFIMFRSSNVKIAIKIYKSLIGINISSVNYSFNLKLTTILVIAFLLSILSKNTQSIFNYNEKQGNSPGFKYSVKKAFILGILLLISLLAMSKPTPFLYFNF
jgi:D-alanyl-lipoteichoic acid acyltransferase DltB (MBOAT superfamily)